MRARVQLNCPCGSRKEKEASLWLKNKKNKSCSKARSSNKNFLHL